MREKFKFLYEEYNIKKKIHNAWPNDMKNWKLAKMNFKRGYANKEARSTFCNWKSEHFLKPIFLILTYTYAHMQFRINSDIYHEDKTIS